MVVQWLALSPHSKKVLGSIAGPDPFSMEFEWVFSMLPATAQSHAKWLNQIVSVEQNEHKCARVYFC